MKAIAIRFFQLPTPCSSPFASSAAHPLQLAIRFFSCPPLCSSRCVFSAAHPLQLAMRFFSCPPLEWRAARGGQLMKRMASCKGWAAEKSATRHALFQLPTRCSSPFAFSAAQPLQLATRFFSCPPLQLAR